MESANLHHHLLPRPLSSPKSNNIVIHHRPSAHDVRSAMLLARISSRNRSSKLPYSNRIIANRFPDLSTKRLALMGEPPAPELTQDAQIQPSQKENEHKDGTKDDESRKEVERPPPPEKPLAGDCCGCGCVSCVWDVYDEELEEYNKLHGSSK